MRKDLSTSFQPLETFPRLRVPADKRRDAAFKCGYDVTMNELADELQKIRATQVVIQLMIQRSDLRMDGHISARATIKDPAVIVTFNHPKVGVVSYPCDTYKHWHDNLRAIAKSLKALRDVERYGVTVSGEQYKGNLKIESPVDMAASFLARETKFTPEQVKTDPKIRETVFREKAMKYHPDTFGGDAALMARLTEARATIVTQS